MLIQCPECATEISSQAVACPKCGHPNAPQPAAGAAQPTAAIPVPPAPTLASAPKSSHVFGLIALVAFLFANFTPAILAPILVLAGLVLAGKELAGGGKILGGIAMVLCLLQGAFVLQHFGGVASSGGAGPRIVPAAPAAETTKNIAAQYANVAVDVEANWKDIAHTKCTGDWPADYKMQEFCENQQRSAVLGLSQGAPAGVDTEAFHIIRGKCAGDWPTDFNMRKFCEGQQYGSYLTLKGTTGAGAGARNSCAEQWPSDFHMRQYCESRGG